NHLVGRQASAMLDGESVKARMAFLHAPGQGIGSFLWRMVCAGPKAYVAAAKTPGDVEALEDDYWALNENAEEDAKLTATERSWAGRGAHADGKLTANEQALLAELQKIETSTD